MKTNQEKVWDMKRLETQAKGKMQYDNYILENIGIDKLEKANVLDLGCSNGFKTYELFNRENIDKVVGVDWSSKAIEQANEKYQGNKKFSFICDDIYNINFEEKFDIVYLSFVLHHAQDKIKLLKKVFSLLKNGGYVVIKTIDDSSIIAYPDEKGVIDKILKLYDTKIKNLSVNTKFTDRYHGKKCYAQLFEAGFKNIKLTLVSSSKPKKTDEERKQAFEVGFGFRNVDINSGIKNRWTKQMDGLLARVKDLFDDPQFIYMNPAYYFSAQKVEE